MKTAILTLSIVFLCIAFRGNAVAGTIASYGPVQQNETLYRIALKYYQQGVTVSQLMMSIYYANPEAFHQNNINRLKVGAMLAIPDQESVGSLSPRQAYTEALAQVDTYEKEVRELKVGQGELAPLSQAPREPELVTGVEFELSEPDQAEIEEVKQVLAIEGQQIAQLALPEPKPEKRKKKAKSRKSSIRYSYDLSIIDDDNVRLAQDDDDIRSDGILSTTIKASGGKTIDSFTIWNYGARATYNKFDTFDKLDNAEFEVNTRYRFALASGFTSPIYSLGAKLGGIEFDSEMRDSTILTLSAGLTRWLSNTINMTTGLVFKERESVSEVYDTSEARIFINFDTELTKKDLVYTTLSLITGDIVSSATPTVDIINVADAIEPDDAFGGVDANQFAYRIDADTVVVTLGYNRIINREISLDFSARFVDSEAKDDSSIGYERTILRASLLGRF